FGHETIVSPVGLNHSHQVLVIGGGGDLPGSKSAQMVVNIGAIGIAVFDQGLEPSFLENPFQGFYVTKKRVVGPGNCYKSFVLVNGQTELTESLSLSCLEP